MLFRRSFLAVLLLATTLAPSAGLASERWLILATTTSVRDSGLLDALLPDFTAKTGIEVRVIAVGTGAALRMGREGNADVLLTHAPAAEQVLVDEGIVTRRTPFMENFFVIAGPAEDPAAIAEAESPEEAVKKIAERAPAGSAAPTTPARTRRRRRSSAPPASIRTPTGTVSSGPAAAWASRSRSLVSARPMY